jgi:hypothetical protein
MNWENFPKIAKTSFTKRLFAAKKTNKEINYLEESFKIRLPKSYRQFLLEKPSLIMDGFKFFGLSTNEIPVSLLESTLVLRKRRDDLPQSYRRHHAGG